MFSAFGRLIDMKPGSRLPSISMLLSLIGLALLLPVAAIAISQWQSAEIRFEGAVSVDKSVDRLDVLIRLSPAINDEIRSTTWNSGGDELLTDLPPNIAEFLGTDFGASMPADRILVDTLLEELDEADIRATITDIRTRADANEFGLFDGAALYDEVVDQVERMIDSERVTLNEAAVRAGDNSIARASRVAEAAADVQIVTSGQADKWAQLSASPYLVPTMIDVVEFANSVSLYHERADALDQLINPQDDTGRLWTEYVDSDETKELFEKYDDMVAKFTEAGLPDGPEGSTTLDLTNVGIGELLGLAGQVNSVLQIAEDVNAQYALIVDSSLADLEEAAANAVDDASGDRNRTILWLASAALMVTTAVLALVVLIGRPVRNMADAAEQLSVGQLDIELDERGPTELRNSARALNQALRTMRLTESQAVALAEERLDDPILEKHAMGGIGDSLQTAVARLAKSLSERENFQQQLAHEAAHDGLTKLSNRNAILRHLNAALARTRRSSTSLALLFLDIDDFKAINDAHGHHAGDAVLRHVAQRLVGAIREGDLAGRMGGDEFVVVAEAVADIAEALDLSNRIVELVCQPVVFDGGTIIPSLSIGVAIADGKLSADEIIRDADLAVYRAKSEGKGRIDVCDEDLRGEVRERESIVNALEDAIERDEFVLHFQPSVNASDHTITSFEALIRWNHPDRGVVGPNDFIPIAERSNLIAKIDRWVLNAASAQLAEWTEHPELGRLPVAVNISGRHLGSGTLTEDVLQALREHGVDPGRLLLEVTETALLADLVMAARELSQLREAGVRVALDDFGTGYMSLSHLRNLPVDVLKIDQTFIAEIGSDTDHPLIQLIVDTGHLLGVDVTAEGVETALQADVLTKMGVDSMQGFLFGYPVKSDSVEPDGATSTTP